MDTIQKGIANSRIGIIHKYKSLRWDTFHLYELRIEFASLVGKPRKYLIEEHSRT